MQRKLRHRKISLYSQRNFKHSYNDLSCDFCSGNEEMTQTHLQEECRGTGFERRGLDMSDWRGVLGFWRRMTSRLSGGLTADGSIDDAPNQRREATRVSSEASTAIT